MQDFKLSEHDENVSVSFIRDTETLSRLCSEWLSKEAIAVDTEFDRTNTYFHNLALIQINDGQQIWFIDPLELKDVSPLKSVFESETLVKIFHSCGEDLEALFNKYHFKFNQIFDTQIAAAFADMGPSLGYLRLVELISGVSLDKEHTKTDWMQRPLQQEQLIYAAQDVQFLLPSYYMLRDKMLELGTFEYVIQDVDSMFEAVSAPENYDSYYLRMKGIFRLDAKQTNRLKHVASWREQLARLKNIPKTFIFRDPQLLEICQTPNPKMSDLLAAGCHRASIRRYGAELLATITQADLVNPELWPEPVKAFHKIPKAKELSRQLKALANQVADKNDIPQEVLTNKRLIEYYIMRNMKLDVRPNRFWNDWRKTLLSEAFEAVQF
ncbi:HRDC domain-containing protein [Kangiella sp. HZ709]|uniref:ribonuclease D n=1 Tax=Kangiella sp. HZ709 TaxID=2666328 RepID=UPI0012AF19F8|nr:HRDC domain-containing protein [Kangiella sp. HZ709]MRX26805.1 ribonuclease D [Kangiella sp. HZ709]